MRRHRQIYSMDRHPNYPDEQLSRPGRAHAGSSATTTPSVQHSTFSLRAPASEHHGASAARASASDPPFPSSASPHHHHSFPSSPPTPASSSHLSHHHQRDAHHPHHPHPQHQSRQHHHYDGHQQRYHHQHRTLQPSPPRHPAASLHASTSPPLAIAQPVPAHSVTSDLHIMSANGNGHAQGAGHLPPHQTSPAANHHQPYAPAAHDHHGSPHGHHHHQQPRPRSPLHATTSYYSRGATADAHRDMPPSGRVYDPLTDMASNRRPAEPWHGAPQSTPPKVRFSNFS